MKKLLIFLSLLGAGIARAATLASDGSQSDVAAKIASAVDGDTVTLPADGGTPFVWTSGVTIAGKGITIRGAGAGAIIGRSTTTMTIATGAQTFTTQAGLAITSGMSLRVERLGTPHGPVTALPTGVRTYMIGTVDSGGYNSGTGVLTMTMSEAVGTATPQKLWIISTLPQTTIVKNFVTDVLFNIEEDASHSVVFTGIKQTWGAGGGDHVINVSPVTNGKPVIIHACYFELKRHDTGDEAISIRSQSPRGLFYNLSFAGFADIQELNGDQGIQVEVANEAWNELSTMGTADTTGLLNVYIENCRFVAIANATDLSGNSRTVVRYCVFDHSGIGSHGADTSIYGTRHYEIYNNEFLFNGYADGTTLGVNSFIYMRGGTGVIYNNILPDMSSTDFGNKIECRINVQNLRRSGGPNGLWGDDSPSITSFSVGNPSTVTTSTAHGMATGWKARIYALGATPAFDALTTYTVTVTGANTFTIPVNVTSSSTGTAMPVNYPSPRQFGFGRVTGTGYALGMPIFTTPPYLDAIYSLYVGDIEPLYQWGNTGGGNYASPSVEDYGPNEGSQFVDTAVDYVLVGREWINGEKVGWVPYTYPHPMRIAEAASGSTMTVTGATFVNGTLNLP